MCITGGLKKILNVEKSKRGNREWLRWLTIVLHSLPGQMPRGKAFHKQKAVSFYNGKQKFAENKLLCLP